MSILKNPCSEPKPSKPKRKCKGHKGKARERSIKQVVQLVKNWRGLADGSLKMDAKSKVIKKANKRKTQLSRNQAASKIGIPKKSLDDCLLLLRQAKKGGFDFKAHQDCMMGVMRNFIRSLPPLRETQRAVVKLSFEEEFGDLFA
jgi:hypothetical protein